MHPGTTGTTVKNCVSYNNTVNYTNDGTSTVASNNSTSGTDPQFTNPGSGDFTIPTGSPLKDAGRDVSGNGVTNDYTGTARPQGAAFDIGAYEFIVGGASEGVGRGAKGGMIGL